MFGSCIIHILYTECAKIKKNNSGAKRLITQRYYKYRVCSGIQLMLRTAEITLEIPGNNSQGVFHAIFTWRTSRCADGGHRFSLMRPVVSSSVRHLEVE